jgi:Restriction endonuclease S subunits
MEPKIRIKGFDKDWKSIALGEIASFSKGRGYSKADLCSQGNPIILYGRMYTRYSPILEDVDTYAIPQEGSVYSKGNEVIIPGSGETPEDISIASAVLTPGIILGGDLNILSFDESKHNPAFMAMAITNSKTHKELSGYAQGKTIVHLHNKDIAKGQIVIPELDEQASIVEYVKSLDLLIKSSSAKLESYKQIKIACLQEMFPQKGKTVPSVRFKGFEKEWCLYTIGEIGKTYSGITGKTKEDFGTGQARYVTFLNVLNNARIDTSILEPVNIQKEDHQNAVRKGDLFFNTSSETPEEVGMCATIDEDVPNLYLNSFCFGFRLIDSRIDPACFAYMMRSPSGRGMMSILAQGATRYNLSKSAFCKMGILLPADIKEQILIGEYFTALDKQIVLQEKQIEKLRHIKAACLDQMFV